MIKIKIDSRKIERGDTFVAIKGNTVDGHDYIDKAIELGASKIVIENDVDVFDKSRDDLISAHANNAVFINGRIVV